MAEIPWLNEVEVEGVEFEVEVEVVAGYCGLKVRARNYNNSCFQCVRVQDSCFQTRTGTATFNGNS